MSAGKRYSASALADYYACRHIPELERRRALGLVTKPMFRDPFAEALAQRGREHEQRQLDRLSRGESEHESEHESETEHESEHQHGHEHQHEHQHQHDHDHDHDHDHAPASAPCRLTRFPDHTPDFDWDAGAAATLAAMRRGDRLIYQGTLQDATWRGRPDFLLRVDTPSALGAWSYEISDAKLTRHAKPRALIQLCVYSELLATAQGLRPVHMRLVLGDGREEAFRLADFEAYFRRLRGNFLGHDVQADPEPVDHCDLCDWRPVCRDFWRDTDHLSLVAGITRAQRRVLVDRGITTVAALGATALPLTPRPERGSPEALERVQAQASLQVAGRAADRVLHQLILPIEPERGLASLPPPSPGDLFFDIEGAPFAGDDGLEYLLGVADAEGAYQALWATDPASEKAAFEAFIARVMDRLRQWPALHIFHYAPYETTALKKLAARHATRVAEVDHLLGHGVLIDLYRAVRQGVRASVESYSIKLLEPLYGFTRAVELRLASRARAALEVALMMGDPSVVLSPASRGAAATREAVEGYNQDDCLSTLALRDWLEARRVEAATATGAPLPRPAVPAPTISDDRAEDLGKVAALHARLTDGLAADATQRTPAQQAQWLLAQLLEWHRREDKSAWWEYFRLRELTVDELVDERSPLAQLRYLGPGGKIAKSLLHRYAFPPQEHDLRVGSKTKDPVTEHSAGGVHELDDEAGILVLKRGLASKVPHPAALVLDEIVQTPDHKASIFRLGEWVADHGIDARGSHRAARDLLLARPPRLEPALTGPLRRPDEDTVAAATRLALALDHGVLPIQGPPGTGKTYTGARTILALVEAGKKVGITANSHKVISHLLDEICKAAPAKLRITQVSTEDEDVCHDPRVTRVASGGQLDLDDGAHIIAGTSWLWSRESMVGSVDVLVIDEAGQLALANAVACAPAARSLILLGDPQQLDQPRKGVHPPGASASVLEHLLGDHATIPPERGLFLGETHRLHPRICSFTSAAFYDGLLTTRPANQRQTIVGQGSGLLFHPVPHQGNRNRALEEVAAIHALLAPLLRTGSYTDARGVTTRLSAADILIVAPYNAQVAALRAGLPTGLRIGTVDKFQGQEAPISIYSLTTSSADLAPRGLDFLYSPNRLNVATSRARALTIVVASPALLDPTCKTIAQMILVNALCRFHEQQGTGPGT
ncbi:MAG: TM0106 family RecB-like putative nuclease [Deltaproteobacteria bacterium]|nr:TM0106 family RecB-like putative nuclease [Deltaproteobacteria bacterium]